MDAAFAQLVQERRGWGAPRVDLFNSGFARYWERSTELARRTSTWTPPRLRHVAVVGEPLAVPPFVQLLNTSAWLLYDCDLDPESSDPELLAYLLVHGDRLAASGEVTLAAVHTAAYWFAREPRERAAFAAAAGRSRRPDGEAFRLLADALDWLGALHHETLRPAQTGAACRAIPGTGLRVPRKLEHQPDELVERWAAIARKAVLDYRGRWRATDAGASQELCAWLRDEAPPLLVTGRGGEILWEPRFPDRLGRLRSELKVGSGAAIRDVAADLRTVERHTRSFAAALVDPSALPRTSRSLEERGYAYLHPARGLIAYNLHEPGIDRLVGPALPFARAMLGARTLHEWAHLAVEAGWVPQVSGDERFVELCSAFAGELDRTIRDAPAAARERGADDLLDLARRGSHDRGSASRAAGGGPGTALVEIFLGRLSDYRANLLACRLMTFGERETYVRHNIRTLRGELPPSRLWRMLIRYLYEYQYLGFSAVRDPYSFFVHGTWFDVDFLATAILDEQRFHRLAAAAQRICASFAPDAARFRAPAGPLA
jgi:hypothetical protein